MRRPSGGSFGQAVYAVVRRVPRGRVVTYGQVAALVGVPRAARAVGQAMRRCPAGVPWHRVVSGRGTVSPRGDREGMLSQRILLAHEGVRIVGHRLDLGRHGWRGAAPRFRPDLLSRAR